MDFLVFSPSALAGTSRTTLNRSGQEQTSQSCSCSQRGSIQPFISRHGAAVEGLFLDFLKGWLVAASLLTVYEQDPCPLGPCNNTVAPNFRGKQLRARGGKCYRPHPTAAQLLSLQGPSGCSYSLGSEPPGHSVFPPLPTKSSHWHRGRSAFCSGLCSGLGH